ncbi:hypothetical protein F53441_1475 [Fusarium austroafricanum]|uniref:Uncharacterized protein n=1 Tax=Fusarium austroafricanum TaxID=2364996 RepID=A0A8H4P274_9HYPO|nr:hypothetical protein F53441_1475 [Fusarium austroafricanum]
MDIAPLIDEGPFAPRYIPKICSCFQCSSFYSLPYQHFSFYPSNIGDYSYYIPQSSSTASSDLQSRPSPQRFTSSHGTSFSYQDVPIKMEPQFIKAEPQSPYIYCPDPYTMSSYPVHPEGNGFNPLPGGFDFNTVPRGPNNVQMPVSGLVYNGSTYNLIQSDMNYHTTHVSYPHAPMSRTTSATLSHGQMSPTPSVASPQTQMSPESVDNDLPYISPSRVEEMSARLPLIFKLLENYPNIPAHPIPEEILNKPKDLVQQRSLVMYLRKYEVSYEEIRAIGALTVADSTMRYWSRTSKPKSARPRRPKWKTKDVAIMYQAVEIVEDQFKIHPDATGFYSRVAVVMQELGASHGFSAQAISAKFNGRKWGDVARTKKQAARAE